MRVGFNNMELSPQVTMWMVSLTSAQLFGMPQGSEIYHDPTLLNTMESQEVWIPEVNRLSGMAPGHV